MATFAVGPDVVALGASVTVTAGDRRVQPSVAFVLTH